MPYVDTRHDESCHDRDGNLSAEMRILNSEEVQVLVFLPGAGVK